MQIAENLPLFKQFSFGKGLFKDLTAQEVHTIMLIGRLDAPRMTELAERGHVTQGTMTVMVNKLVRKGYVRRMRDAGDRRVVRVTLTARGRQADKTHIALHKQMIDGILGALTEAEQEQAVQLIRKVVAALG
jgi:DNA-binding MarR family transcriptional regulator